MSAYKVQQGDCFLSIAENHQIPWKILWEYPLNAELKGMRKHPTILKPGDTVQIPDKDGSKEVSGQTEAKHRFQKIRRNEAKLRLRLLYRGQPLAQKSCKVILDGQLSEKATDDNGVVEFSISPTAAEGTLEVEGDPEKYVLKLGWLDPMDYTSGLQARLNNLGFLCGAVDDDYGTNTRKAMQGFQESQTIAKSDQPNAETREALEREYGYSL